MAHLSNYRLDPQETAALRAVGDASTESNEPIPIGEATEVQLNHYVFDIYFRNLWGKPAPRRVMYRGRRS